MRTSRDMNSSRGGSEQDRKVREMLRAKLNKEYKVSVEDIPAIVNEYERVKNQIIEQKAYIDRARKVNKREIEQEYKEKLASARDTGYVEVARKEYQRALLKLKFNPPFTDELDKLEELEERFNILQAQMDYINSKYSDVIEEARKEEIRRKVIEAGLHRKENEG